MGDVSEMWQLCDADGHAMTSGANMIVPNMMLYANMAGPTISDLDLYGSGVQS